MALPSRSHISGQLLPRWQSWQETSAEDPPLTGPQVLRWARPSCWFLVFFRFPLKLDSSLLAWCDPLPSVHLPLQQGPPLFLHAPLCPEDCPYLPFRPPPDAQNSLPGAASSKALGASKA